MTTSSGSLEFDCRWVEDEHVQHVQHIQGEELRATFSRLRISVDGVPITRVLDRDSEKVRDYLLVPAYPLAEWIAYHCWFLLYETRNPCLGAIDEYPQRHNLRFGSEGYALPDLEIIPTGNSVYLRYDHRSPNFAHVEFLKFGDAYADQEQVTNALASFLEVVLNRLHDKEVARTPLEEEWEAIRMADAREAALCRYTAKLGMDPSALEDDAASRLAGLIENVPEGLRDEFFSNATAATAEEDLAIVRGALDRAAASEVEFAKLGRLRRELTPCGMLTGHPWAQGYRAARELRARIDGNLEPFHSVEALLERLGVPGSEVETLCSVDENLPVTFQGVLGVNAKDTPGMVMRPTHEYSRTFVFCRALFEYLYRREKAALVTTNESETQQRNRAFAAELLAPSRRLRELVTKGHVGWVEIASLAAKFHVSEYVIAHQIENHHLARIVREDMPAD